MSFFRILCFTTFFFKCVTAMSQASFSESKRASAVIGQFLSEATSHRDFLTATPIGPRRSGDKMFVSEQPVQTASDYGVSFESVPYSREVLRSYDTLGISTAQLAKSIDLPRAHLAWGFANKFDFSASYLLSSEVSGWGLGLKTVLYQSQPFFISHKFRYSRAARDNYFTSDSISNEFTASLYLKLVDAYLGFSHSAGIVDFKSSVPALQLPQVRYIADPTELQFYYGASIATTTNTRIAIQANHSHSEFWVGLKASFRFDSLLPTVNNWFADPRRIKQ